jgi:tetratricopeptide (TPR) repeat protein
LRQDWAGDLVDETRSIAVSPDEPAPFAERGRAYHALGEDKAAIVDLRQVTALVPSEPDAWSSLCQEEGMSGAFDDALADCDRSLRLRARNAAAFDSRGLVFLRTGKFAKAIVDYGNAIRLAPGAASPLYGRGIAERRLGNVAGAAADLAAAQQLEPGIAAEFARIGLVP